MNKQRLLKIVNVLLGLDFILLVSSAMLSNVIPRQMFNMYHPLFGAVFTILVIAHISLNFKWIKANFFKKKN